MSPKPILKVLAATVFKNATRALVRRKTREAAIESMACKKISSYELSCNESTMTSIASDIYSDTKNRAHYLSEIRIRIKYAINTALIHTDFDQVDHHYDRAAILLQLALCLGDDFSAERERLEQVSVKLAKLEEARQLRDVVPTQFPEEDFPMADISGSKSGLGTFLYILAVVLATAKIAYNWYSSPETASEFRPTVSYTDYNSMGTEGPDEVKVAEEGQEPAETQAEETVEEMEAAPLVEPLVVEKVSAPRPKIGGLEVSDLDTHAIGPMDEVAEFAWLSLVWQEGNRLNPTETLLKEYRGFQTWYRDHGANMPVVLGAEIEIRRRELLGKLYLRTDDENLVVPIYDMSDQHKQSLERKKQFFLKVKRQ